MTENSREVNIPLLRKAVEWAEAEAAKPAIDSRWQQGGWISDPDEVADQVLDGTPFADLPWRERSRLIDQLAPHCGTAYCIAGYVAQSLDQRYAASLCVEGVGVAEFAVDALGLTDKEGSANVGTLFYASNTIEDVRRIAEDIAGERL